MKEGIGSISLFAIVVVFVLIFTAYICLSINYSKAYNIKNEIVNIIKNQGGVCTDTYNTGSICYNFADQINDYFKEMNYRSVGKCDSGWVGYSKTGEKIGEGVNNASFCVKGIPANTSAELPNAVFYQIKVFYQLDLPVVNLLFNLSVIGETGRVYEPNECTNGGLYSWC